MSIPTHLNLYLSSHFAGGGIIDAADVPMEVRKSCGSIHLLFLFLSIALSIYVSACTSI